MKRCKHSKAILYETGEFCEVFCVQNGELKDRSSGNPFETGEIRVECCLCNKEWHFGKKVRKYPKWIVRLIEAAHVPF